MIQAIKCQNTVEYDHPKFSEPEKITFQLLIFAVEIQHCLVICAKPEPATDTVVRWLLCKTTKYISLNFVSYFFALIKSHRQKHEFLLLDYKQKRVLHCCTVHSFG